VTYVIQENEAGETMRQTFKSPGEFIGECTVHPSGQIAVTVSA